MRFNQKVLLAFVVVGSVEWVHASPLKPECERNCENNGQPITKVAAMIEQGRNNFASPPNGGSVIGAKIEQNIVDFNGGRSGRNMIGANIKQGVNTFGSSTEDRTAQKGDYQQQTILSFTSDNAPVGSSNQNSGNVGALQAPGYATNGYQPAGPAKEYLCYQYAPNGRPLYAYSSASYPTNGYLPSTTLYKFIVCGTIRNPGQNSSPGNAVHIDTGANGQVPMLPSPASGNIGGPRNESSPSSPLDNAGPATEPTPSPVSASPKSNKHKADDSFKDNSTTSLPPTGSKNVTQTGPTKLVDHSTS